MISHILLTVLWDLRKNRKRLVWFHFNPLSSTKRTSKQINIFLRSLYCFEEEKLLSLSVTVEQTGPAGPEQRGAAGISRVQGLC